jgi:acetoin utilization protein AcuC
MGTPAVIVWDPALLAYDLGGDHPFNPVRLDLAVRLARSLGVLDGVELVAPQPATDRDIERVHDPGYLAAVQAAPTAGWDVGHGLGTADNPVFDRMHEAASLVVGGSLLAASRIAAGDVSRAVNIAGGLHHAMPDHAAGFCVYNDCAVAISWLLDNGFDRIAYVDVDVHHGDGVQTAFYTDPRVLTVSLHQHPMTLWPGTGYPREVGADGAEGTAVNIPLPPATRDAAWLRAFHAIVPSVLAKFRPQVLVTQCGVDTHREDPLADLSLSVDGHLAIFRALRDLAERYAGGRWLVLGGGGYELVRVVPRSWTHLLATVLDRDVAPDTPLPADWVAHAAQLAPRVPVPVSMTDGHHPAFTRWDGAEDEQVDSAIRAVRHAVFPLHGLDPHDPRD